MAQHLNLTTLAPAVPVLGVWRAPRRLFDPMKLEYFSYRCRPKERRLTQLFRQEKLLLSNLLKSTVVGKML